MRRGRVAKVCPEYMNLSILQDLKDIAAQYAYMRAHRDGLKYSRMDQTDKILGHSQAMAIRAQYSIELVAEMRSKLTSFAKRAKTKCL